MRIPLLWVELYLLAVSLWAAVLTVVDKRRARAHRRRVPEATLLWVAVLGGTLGEYLAMRAVHHKTRHRKFMWGLPVLLALQVLALWYAIDAGWVA